MKPKDSPEGRLKLVDIPPYWVVWLEIWLVRQTRLVRIYITASEKEDVARSLAASLNAAYDNERKPEGPNDNSGEFKVYPGGFWELSSKEKDKVMQMQADNKRPVKGRLLIVDAMALVYRAYFAIPARKSPVTNEPTNAISGFTSMLITLLERVRPEHVVIALEGGKSFRSEIYPDYKSTRPGMPAELREQVGRIVYLAEKCLGIPCYHADGYEADDVIAALVHQAKSFGLTTVISTGDKDMLQLVEDEKVSVIMAAPKFADSKPYGPSQVFEKYGFEPARLPLYLALQGDKVDGVPGVPGVGEMTAKKLVATYGDVGKLMSAARDSHFGIPQKQLRAAIRDNAGLIERNLQLVKLEPEIPGWTSGFTPGAALFGANVDQARLDKLFNELGFSRDLSGRLSGLLSRQYELAAV